MSWYTFASYCSSDQHSLCISWSLWFVSPLTLLSLHWHVSEDELWELKAPRLWHAGTVPWMWVCCKLLSSQLMSKTSLAPRTWLCFESISGLHCLCRYLGESFFHVCSIFGERFYFFCMHKLYLPSLTMEKNLVFLCIRSSCSSIANS